MSDEVLDQPQIEDKLNLGFNEIQKNRFSLLGQRVKRKEITPSQAWKLALQEGEGDDKGFKGTFKQWITIAEQNGWIGSQQKTEELKVSENEIIEAKKTNYVMPILIGAGLAILLIYAIKKFSKND